MAESVNDFISIHGKAVDRVSPSKLFDAQQAIMSQQLKISVTVCVCVCVCAFMIKCAREGA